MIWPRAANPSQSLAEYKLFKPSTVPSKECLFAKSRITHVDSLNKLQIQKHLWLDNVFHTLNNHSPIGWFEFKKLQTPLQGVAL